MAVSTGGRQGMLVVCTFVINNVLCRQRDARLIRMDCGNPAISAVIMAAVSVLG
ncbi:MAG: hypothetical protein GY717_15775 [Rhodobacteraceae bacterium]|nr:hypothetical protein [Paracoccaceae bacterium]